MAFCTLNNITLRVAADTGDRDWTEIGARERAFDGTLRTTRSKLKRAWSLSTKPLIATEVDAWVALLQGRGHSWDFTSEYSSKGLVKTSQNGTPTFNAASGKFDKKLQLDATEWVRWTPSGDDVLTGDYTLTVWRLETGVWHHYVIRKTGGSTNKWVDGVSNDAAATAWLTVTAGVIQLGDATNADDFSNLVALPFSIPSSWVASLYASTRAYPAIPKLELGGDIVSSPTTPISTKALVERETPAAFPSSGVWQPGARRIELRLEEV